MAASLICSTCVIVAHHRTGASPDRKSLDGDSEDNIAKGDLVKQLQKRLDIELKVRFTGFENNVTMDSGFGDKCFQNTDGVVHVCVYLCR